MKKENHVIIRTDSKNLIMTQTEREILSSIGAKIYEVELAEEIYKFDEDSEIFNAEAIIVSNNYIKEDLINRLKNLKIISSMGIGVDKIGIDTATKNGVVVANCPKFCIGEVADHVMAFLLAGNKTLIKWDKLFRKCALSEKAWDGINELQNADNVPIRICGKKLGLIGFGNIARAVTERARPFGLEVWAYDPYVDKKIFEKYKVKESTMEAIFKNCEFVSLHIPFKKETYHLIGKKYFKMMKPEATFINTARGQIVVEEDLIRALKEKWIACAAVDVYEYFAVRGPNLPKVDSPYFELDNVILTPHISANSKESFNEVTKTSSENVVRVLTGYWPEDYVNKDVIPKNKLQKYNYKS